MRTFRTLLLFAGTILALSLTLAPGSASAQAFPFGDTDPNNWRAVQVKKPVTTGTPPACSTAPVPTTLCTGDTGFNNGFNEWTWRYWGGTPQVNVQTCRQVQFKIRAGFDGRTVVDSGSWDQWNLPSPMCQYNDLQGYATRTDLAAALAGRICHHVPTGRKFLHQRFVMKNWSNGVETHRGFFSELTGTAFANQVMETTNIKTAGYPGYAPTDSASTEVLYTMPFTGWRIQPTGTTGAGTARNCF